MVIFDKWMRLSDMHFSFKSECHVVHLYYREELYRYTWRIYRGSQCVDEGSDKYLTYEEICKQLEQTVALHDKDYQYELDFQVW